MANETRKYLDHLTRTTADTITGEILERMPDSTYRYKDVATGAERYATTNLGDNFAIGSRVRIDRPSASRNVIGSQDVIVNRAPREQRGLSGTTPAIDRDGFDRAVIVSVDPDPLVLVAGGAPGTQTIRGSGFDAPAEYFKRGTGSDPIVADDDDPSVTDTEVVMHIAAAADSPTGRFDVNVSGATASNALTVVAPAPIEGTGFFVVGLGASARTLGAFVDGTAVVSESADLGGVIARFDQIDNASFLVFLVGGGGRVVTIDLATAAFTLGSLGTHPQPPALRQVAFFGGFAYYDDDNGHYVEVDIDTGVVARTLRTLSGFPAYVSSCYDPTTDSLFTATNIGGSGSGETGIRLRKINRATAVETNVFLSATGTSSFVLGVAAMTSDGASVIYVRYNNPSSGSRSVRLARMNAAAAAIASETDNFSVGSEVPQAIRRIGTYVISYYTQLSTGLRSVRRHAETASGSGHATAASSGHALSYSHMVIVPAAENEDGIDLLYRMASVDGGQLVLRVHDIAGDFATPLGDVTCSATELTVDCEAYGLGWTARTP